MNWNELSNEAKGIIEWIEDPYTGIRRTLEIKVGDYFEPETKYGMKPTKIMVTSEIYQEILKFVNEDNELQCEQFTDGLIFKIKDSSKLRLC